MIWAGHTARIGKMRIAYNSLVGKPEWRRQLARPRHRCEDNIRLILGK